MKAVAVDDPDCYYSRDSRTRWSFVVGLVLVASLGLTGCSGSGETSGAKDKSSESKTEDDSSDWKAISEKALVSTDMEMLSDHKPQLDEPSHPAKVELPFQGCDVGKDLYEGIRDSAFQMFDGEPNIAGRGFAVDGSAKDQFAKLREAWSSNTCDSYESVSDADGSKYEFKDGKQIDTPKDMGEDTWFATCYEGTSESGDTIGECRVIYVVGDDAIAEVISQQPVDENELNATFLTLIAMEALSG